MSKYLLELLEKIVKICRGDLRKAINFLQRCHNTLGDEINEALLDDLVWRRDQPSSISTPTTPELRFLDN